MARQLAAAGARLILISRNAARLTSLAEALRAKAITADARESNTVEACLTRVAEFHGRLDGITNCVGSLLLKPAHLTSDSEWAEVLSTHLTTSFYILRSGARLMMSRGGGAVVLVASAVAERGMINHEAIAAAGQGGDCGADALRGSHVCPLSSAGQLCGARFDPHTTH